MTLAAAYGLCIIVLSLVAGLSRDRTTLVMVPLLGFEWIGVAGAVGDDRFYLANPATIATVAIAFSAMTRLLPVNRLTLLLTALYSASMALAVWAAFAGVTLERWYFDAINGTFALRLLAVGGWGVWCVVCRWRSVGPGRALPLRPRAATLARHRPF